MRPLSKHKIGRLYQLFFQGLPQHTIAKRLDISQGAVSLHTSQLEGLAKELGVESLLEEGPLMDEVRDLRDLAVELHTAHLSAEECRCGLKTRLALAKCGIGPDDYGHLAKCAKEMDAGGHIDAAIRLAKLEAKTGLSYEHVLNTYEDTCHKLEVKQLELSKTSADAEAAKKERANAIQERKAAVAELEDAMQKLGLDGARVTRVEALERALKKADADN